MTSLIDELQAEALDPKVRIADLLRKAKVVAEKLDICEFADWIGREMNGYAQNDEFPAYRKLHSEFQALNPYHGWQPMIFSEPEKVKGLFEPRELVTPAGQIEANPDPDTDYAFVMQPEVKAQLIKGLEYPADVRCLLNRMEVLAIPQHVRNLILDWSLRLDKAGVRGEGLSFSHREKEQAHSVSINVRGNVQNLSSVVDAARSAIVATTQTAAGQGDVEALDLLVEELRQHIAVIVPPERRAILEERIGEIEAETKSVVPDRGKLRRALIAAQGIVRDSAAGAATSLMVQGALGLIADALRHL
jgi:hypothetical protein